MCYTTPMKYQHNNIASRFGLLIATLLRTGATYTDLTKNSSKSIGNLIEHGPEPSLTPLQERLNELYPGISWLNIYFSTFDSSDIEFYVTVRRNDAGLFELTTKQIRKVKEGPQRVGPHIQWTAQGFAPHPDICAGLPFTLTPAYTTKTTFDVHANSYALDHAYRIFTTFHNTEHHKVSVWFDNGRLTFIKDRQWHLHVSRYGGKPPTKFDVVFYGRSEQFNDNETTYPVAPHFTKAFPVTIAPEERILIQELLPTHVHVGITLVAPIIYGDKVPRTYVLSYAPGLGWNYLGIKGSLPAAYLLGGNTWYPNTYAFKELLEAIMNGFDPSPLDGLVPFDITYEGMANYAQTVGVVIPPKLESALKRVE